MGDGLHLLTGGAPNDPRGMELGFVDADGGEHRVPLAAAAGVPFEHVRPVRSFPTFKGQRNFPGWYYAATTQGHITFESWLERDHLMCLDFDPEVRAIAAQPFWLFWTAEDGRGRSHAPDLFALRRDGSALVVDSRPADRIKPRDQRAFEATRQACSELGWDYRVWGQVDPVFVANVRWLAGYRHERCYDTAVADRLRVVFAQALPLMQGAAETGEPLRTLPVLFYLMWRGELEVNLSLLLGEHTPVRVARGAVR
ncbi:TnsA-like heteromeric transposase endonuclease subunit [Nocardiopsis alkaliphila]|uniref:TnsA-like heteromeric transposase endonuclease subunit n=1 Tax=Nocardiopsis alkaliphila TaxID=225762 RepID=UPI00037A8316|nr:TnsA-like heteromeric transposase endonuclease subunit [Nocardiopsis alkaliphila]